MSTETATETFNASLLLTRRNKVVFESIAKFALDFAISCIGEIATRHEFDPDEELKVLGLEDLCLKFIKEKEKKKKEKTQKKEKKTVSKFPMPFSKSGVNANGCQGLVYNRGLFTQCPKTRLEEGKYCKGCQSNADKNASGCPDCGTVDARMSTGLYEFKDPKGRHPTPYVKVLESMKLNVDECKAEWGTVIDELHFKFVETPKKKATRGRPKKDTAPVTENAVDLFTKLVPAEEEAEEAEEELEEEPKKEEPKKEEPKQVVIEPTTKPEQEDKKKKVEEAREEQRKAKKEKEAIEKAEKEAKKAAEKAEKEAKKAAEQLEKDKKAAKKIAKKQVVKEINGVKYTFDFETKLMYDMNHIRVGTCESETVYEFDKKIEEDYELSSEEVDSDEDDGDSDEELDEEDIDN